MRCGDVVCMIWVRGKPSVADGQRAAYMAVETRARWL